MALTIHDERLTRRVGAGVLAVVVLTVIFFVFIRDRLRDDGVLVRVYFREVLGLPEGAPVKIIGRDIGTVRAIAIGNDGAVVVTLSIDPEWAEQIASNADFFVDARAVLAPRYIAIGPPPNHAAPARPLRDGDEVVGIDPPNLDRVLRRTWDSLDDLQRFRDALEPAAARIAAAGARIAATVRALEPRLGASAALNQAVGALVDDLRAALTDLRAAKVDPAQLTRLGDDVDVLAARIEVAAGNLRGQLAQLRINLVRVGGLAPGGRDRLGRALAVADQALADVTELAQQARAVVAMAHDGDGSIAAFGADLELVDDVRELTKVLKRQPWRLATPPPQ